jgi:hypothetical protein
MRCWAWCVGCLLLSVARAATSQLPPDQAVIGPIKPPAKRPALTVRGLVIDAATKRPIVRFRVIPGCVNGNGATWQPHLITNHQHGLFELPPGRRFWAQTQFRVEAEGYRPAVSRVMKDPEGDIKLIFSLHADPGISAVVRTSDGALAAGAQATWATLSHEATGHGASITLSGHSEALGAAIATADAAGRLRLKPECDPGIIIVAHSSGHAEIKPADLMASGAVALRPWCRVEGRVLSGTKPVAGQKICVYRHGFPGESSPTYSWEDEAITDADGRFACDRVTPGRLIIDRVFASRDGEGAVHGLASSIEVREGQTTRVSLGGPGRALVGRMRATKDFGLPIDWSKVRVQLGLPAPHIGFPGDDSIWEIYRAFLNTEEGKTYDRDNLPVERDGSFRIESVPPGDYVLSVWLCGPAVGRPTETTKVYGSGHTFIVLSPTWDEQNGEALSLGTIELRPSSPDATE